MLSEKARKYHRDWKRAKYQRDPTKWRELAWDQRGIDMRYWSYAQFMVMLEAQDGKCLGCGAGIVATRVEAVGGFRIACADHNHSTGRVRGLLCKNCNQAIGFAGDNPEVLEALAKYLRSHQRS